VLAESAGEASEGAATTGSGGLAFEPSDGSEAHPGLAGEFFLRQSALPAEVPKLLAVEDKRLGLDRTDMFTVGVWRVHRESRGLDLVPDRPPGVLVPAASKVSR
jgi:hypothetical protein